MLARTKFGDATIKYTLQENNDGTFTVLPEPSTHKVGDLEAMREEELKCVGVAKVEKENANSAGGYLVDPARVLESVIDDNVILSRKVETLNHLLNRALEKVKKLKRKFKGD